MNQSFAETVYGDKFVHIFHKTIGINANGWVKNNLSDIAIFLTYMISFVHTALTLENVKSNTLEISGGVFKEREHAKKKKIVLDVTMLLTTKYRHIIKTGQKGCSLQSES